MFDDLKVGDVVTRLLGGTIPMELQVTKITDETIECSWWTFDKYNGAEIDEELGWDRNRTGSYIRVQ